jgi:hypothetical protein
MSDSMKRFYLLFLFFLVASVTVINASGNESYVTYYISTTDGNDSNDGLSSQKPFRTFKALPQKHHIRVYLKRGDIFFEQITYMNDCIFDAYGKGQEPILCGFKILKNTDAWKYDERGYWTIDLSNEDDFVGFLAKDHGKSSSFNNVGLIYDAKHDKVYGHRVKNLTLLKEEGDFFLNSQYKKDSVIAHPYKTLYWKTSKDPRTLGNLCFSMGKQGASNNTNIVLRNLAFVGFAIHGIHIGNPHNYVENCRLDLIGGAVLVGYFNWVRYGNGVEVWGNSSNDTIRNCLISRTYDCGTTIQGTGKGNFLASKIQITKNRLYRCRQAFEHFMRSRDGGTAEYENCSFTENLCYLMGDNEFSSPETRDANILANESKDQYLTIQNNTFFGAPLYCAKLFSGGMTDNKVYIYQGQYLNYFYVDSKYPTIYAKNSQSITEYRERTGDNSDIVILTPNSSKARKIEKKISKKIGWKCLDLKIDKLIN